MVMFERIVVLCVATLSMLSYQQVSFLFKALCLSIPWTVCTAGGDSCSTTWIAQQNAFDGGNRKSKFSICLCLCCCIFCLIDFTSPRTWKREGVWHNALGKHSRMAVCVWQLLCTQRHGYTVSMWSLLVVTWSLYLEVQWWHGHTSLMPSWSCLL